MGLHRAVYIARTKTLISMHIPYRVLAYSLAIPFSPMNVNIHFNSLFAYYPSAGLSIPEDWENREKGKPCDFPLSDRFT